MTDYTHTCSHVLVCLHMKAPAMVPQPTVTTHCPQHLRTPAPGCLHTRPLALVPEPVGALLGTVPKDSADWKRIAGEAARTIPGCGRTESDNV